MRHKNGFLFRQFFASITVLLLFCVINTVPAQTTLPTEDVTEKALALTVYLEMEDKSGKILGIGSGFFVKPDLIATNYHVIEGATKGTAKLVGKSTVYTIEGITAADRINDLVLLKVAAYVINPFPLGDSNDVDIGTTVHVIDNPIGLEGIFSDGIVSPINPEGGIQKLIHIMGTSISPVSSGSPVFDSKWSVIGVFVSTPNDHLGLGTENLDHVIPVNVLKELLNQSGTVIPFSPEQQPISAKTHYRWGYTQHEVSNYEGAIANYDMAIRLNPDYALAYYRRGVAKGILKQHFAATIDFNIANRLEPDAATFGKSMGDFSLVLGNHNRAISHYNMAIRLKPDYAEAYYNRGKAKFNLEKYFDAISDYDMAIRLKPDYAEAYDYRGLAKCRLGQHAVAIVDFSTAIRLKPDYVDAYNNRGLARFNLKQYASAVTDYDKAIQLNPNYASAYFRRGSAKSELGQHFAALSDIDRSICLRPGNADSYLIRGLVKGGKLGQHAAAIVDYDKAIQIESGNAEVYYFRGFSKFYLDRTWEARQNFQTALKLAEKLDNVHLKVQIEETLQRMSNE
ncbi:MAG: tetratricopeptide repeat protein [Candidatus Poribacteria bacterium]|nr:tetratricopeptide repeat protein [Candidatus Poribacteria bacterium]